MKKNHKKITMIMFAIFMLFMLIMTITARIINASVIPEVEIYKVNSQVMYMEKSGRGVVKYGMPEDDRIFEKAAKSNIYYVEGCYYDKNYIDGIGVGSSVNMLFHDTGKEAEGTLAAKMYDYKSDMIDVVILLDDDIYTAGDIVDFITGNVRNRFPYCVPNAALYQDIDGNYYVYIMENHYSILGNETIAVKVYVSILAQNETRTAIEEDERIDMNSKIIGRHEDLKDGAKVRQKEY